MFSVTDALGWQFGLSAYLRLLVFDNTRKPITFLWPWLKSRQSTKLIISSSTGHKPVKKVPNYQLTIIIPLISPNVIPGVIISNDF